MCCGHVSCNDKEPTEVGPHLRDETCHPTVAQSFSNFSGHTNPPGILLKAGSDSGLLSGATLHFYQEPSGVHTAGGYFEK